MNKKIIAVIIFVFGIVIGGASFYLFQGGKALSSEEATKIAIDFINKNIQEGLTASVLDVSKLGDIYKIHFKIAEAEYESYITKDGKFLFPTGINLTEQPKEEAVPESSGQAPTQEVLADFAKCLTEKGAKFYGVSYCSWCKKEKDLFGEAAQYLPYIECVDEETQETTPACKEANITSFPTWEFNGEKNPGFRTLEQLSELSGCQL